MKPILLQQAEILLERNLLTASITEDVQPVQTVGQEVDGVYDATNTSSSGAAFDYEWGD